MKKTLGMMSATKWRTKMQLPSRGGWKTPLACGLMEKWGFMLTRLCGWRMAKHLLSSGMAPANMYLPQAEFLVVVFADLFHSFHTLRLVSAFWKTLNYKRNRHLNNSVFKLWIYKWFFWTLFCTFVKISSIFLFKKFLWILSQIW